jgi:hypothetical protein
MYRVPIQIYVLLIADSDTSREVHSSFTICLKQLANGSFAQENESQASVWSDGGLIHFKKCLQ